MMLRLIDDVNKALDAECYYAALSLVLTFPDICGKAEYPQEKKSSKRYISWYDQHIGQYENNNCELYQEEPLPYLSGEVVYSLRNSFLHQGTPNIEPLKIKNIYNQIDHFELTIEPKRAFNLYSDSAGVYNGTFRTYRVNIRRLCLIICNNVRAFYEANQDKFNFFNYNIVDLDVEIEKMKRLNSTNI